jgi:hypothetical protein
MLELISLGTRALNKYETPSLMRFKSLNLPLARMHSLALRRPAGRYQQASVGTVRRLTDWGYGRRANNHVVLLR